MYLGVTVRSKSITGDGCAKGLISKSQYLLIIGKPTKIKHTVQCNISFQFYKPVMTKCITLGPTMNKGAHCNQFYSYLVPIRSC